MTNNEQTELVMALLIAGGATPIRSEIEKYVAATDALSRQVAVKQFAALEGKVY